MEGIRELKSLALEAIEKKSSLLKNEKYIFLKIKRNWKQIVNGPIGEKTNPKGLFNKNLVIVINDNVIYHTTIMCAEVIREKINTFLNGEFLESIEFMKINYKVKRDLLDELIENEENRGTIRAGEIPRGNAGKKGINVESENKITEKIKDIVLSPEEIKEIHRNIDKIDKKYEDIARSLEKVAIKLKKREKYLKSIGYVECEKCKILFLQESNEKLCFECRMNEKNWKFQKISNLIKDNPYISEKQAVRIANTDKSTYYKARDILAQQTYNDMLYYCVEKNKEISVNGDYEFEIRNESREDVEKFIKNYVDYKIGSDNEEVFKIERKAVLRRLKRDVRFRLENSRRY